MSFNFVQVPEDLQAELNKYGISLTDAQRDLIEQRRDRERFDALSPAQRTLFHSFTSLGASRIDAFTTVYALKALAVEVASE